MIAYENYNPQDFDDQPQKRKNREGGESSLNGLLPCPFCGGEADIYDFSRTQDMIYCKGCAMETDTFDTLEALKAFWNTRAR